MAGIETKKKTEADVLASRGHTELYNGNRREACALFSEAVRGYAVENNPEKMRNAAIECARASISVASDNLEMLDLNEANKFLTIARDMLRGIKYVERFPG